MKQKGFIFRIKYVQAQAFDSLTESLSSGVGHFCHMIKLIKYHVTKRADSWIPMNSITFPVQP